MDPKPRLSCEQCRRRKTKCDKQAPCTSCKSAGLVCEAVQRDRLPRGKSGKSRKKGGLLEHRVSRIEELLALAQQGLPAKPERKTSSSGASPASNSSNGDVDSTKRFSSYVASDFWTVLSQEVAGLRETFDEASDDEGFSPPDLVNAYSNMEISANYGQMLFGHSPASIETYSPPYPTAELRSLLLATYKYRADTITKLLHWPTTLARIEEANARGHEDSSTSEQALEFSIYCTAVCTLSDDEATIMLPGERSVLLQQYMQATEIALAQSNLMQRPDITGLLAFVLYINCIWACGKYATKWTLVALAARIGEALGLGREDPRMYSPFELECRRRLWYGIGLVDTHCSYDRGSGPLMNSAALGPMPLDINDSDMHPDSKEIIPVSGFTEMTFTLLTFEAAIHNRRLCEALDWETKLQIAQSYQDIADRTISIASGDNMLEKLTAECARSIASNVHLLLRRPPYKQRSNVVPESDNFDIMGASIKVLEAFLLKESEFDPWEWKEWIPWYALAVILAELCKTPTGPVADRAWLLAQDLYQKHARPASDLETGMLWKPLTKLMRRVQRERPSHSDIEVDSANSSAPAPQTTLVLQDYAALPGTNAVPFTYERTFNMNGQQQQPLPTQPWTSSETPSWPVFGLYPPTTSEVDNRGSNTKLYNDLDPAKGVSWLDWDAFLDDPSYGMMIT